MINTGAKTGAALVCAAAIALMSGGSVLAQGKLKRWSDESVQCAMEYAWQLTPSPYTGPDGKTIVVDKTKKKQVDVPLEVGREAVETGRVSALAQVCGLPEEQISNQRTFMRREEVKGKWSPQQLLYIRTIHLATVMLLTGQLDAKDLDTGKKFTSDEPVPVCAGAQVVERKPPKRTGPCPEEHKEQVRKLVSSYVDAKPAAPPPSKTAEPVKAGTQKK